MTNTDLAWLAGLLEGEGSFCFSGSPAIRMGSTDLDIVTRAATLLGDKRVYSRPARSLREKAFHYVDCCGRDATTIMLAILPLMGSRRSRRILEVLSLGAARPGRGGEHELTEASVAEIRAGLVAGHLRRDLAQIFSVHRSVIDRIASGQAWAQK